MTGGRAPRAAAALACSLAATLLVGCQAGPGRPPVVPGGSASRPAASRPAASATAAQPPATLAGQPPFVPQRPPAGAPGQLAARTDPPGASPPGPAPAGTRYAAQLWYAGVPIGPDGAGLLVAYPAAFLSATGGRAIVHVKLPLFRCTGRTGPGSPNFRGCVRRRVEYADLVAPAPEVRVSRLAGDRITVAGAFPTYTYGPAIDRDPGLTARWTGRTFLVRVDAKPGRALAGAPGTFAGLGTVTLGSGAAAVTAAVDAGYPNRLTLAYS